MSQSTEIKSLATPDELHAWIHQHFEATIATKAVVESHAAPFDYLIHTFFEGASSPGTPPDSIIWANRGGGKTYLGALATALDLLFKPGIQIRILAGSVEQGARMHQHLRAFLERDEFKKEIKGRITDRRIALKNGAAVELLAQSQASVRGTRPQKLRCDEVELFDDEVWSAAQLTTRSATCGPFHVRGAIECLSTMHHPHGLMSRLIAEANEGKRRLFKWGVIDTLERCPPHRDCNTCALQPECDGAAKNKASGHISIDDALRLKSRVSLPIWDSEMLCNRPTRTHTVFPDFNPATHVFSAAPCHGWPSSDTRAPTNSPCHGWPSSDTRAPSSPLFLSGMDFGFRSPTVFLWASLVHDTLYILDEHYETNQVLDHHIQTILSSPNAQPQWIGADPAGNSRNDHTGVSSHQLLRRAGFDVRSRGSTIAEGCARIAARLKPADGSPPRLYIHERCKNLIRALEEYHYDPRNPTSDEPVKDGPDHAIDALRYLIVNLERPYTARQSEYA
jgi:hypothetical protein